MSNIIYEQYDSTRYPLKRFYYREIPDEILDILLQLCQKELAVFRGGFAFVLLLNEIEYLLKDLDMLALDHNLDNLLVALSESEAENIFVNKNTFGDSVVTAFWKDKNEYYKVDILLCKELPDLCKKVVDGNVVVTVSASYIWSNRIEKIAEKEIRNHDEQKTRNHYKVAKALGYYLLEHKKDIHKRDFEIVRSRLEDASEVLSLLITKNELNEFIHIQLDLVRD